MARDVLKIAAGELGTTERPANSNNVKYNTWFYGREVRDTADTKYPWCMAFVQWCFNQAGRKLPYHTASCSALLNWYRKNRPECIVTAPRPGDIIIYNFGHTGIVESVAGSTITAIEGNTSAGEAGSQSNGGGGFRRKRSKTLVTAYIRAFDEEEDDMDINAMISQMTDEQAYRLLQKAKDHAAKLTEPAWSKKEGYWQKLVDGKVFSGAPEDLLRRDEFAAALGRAGLLD